MSFYKPKVYKPKKSDGHKWKYSSYFESYKVKDECTASTNSRECGWTRECRTCTECGQYEEWRSCDGMTMGDTFWTWEEIERPKAPLMVSFYKGVDHPKDLFNRFMEWFCKL